jgi:hypothetical protein
MAYDKVQVIWTCKRFHVGASICTLVILMLLMLPLSLAMDTVSLTMVVAVATQWQQQRRHWRRWTMIGSESGRQQER